MNWVCLECAAENPPQNLVCGSASCQLRRMREWVAGPQSAPASADVEGVSSLELRSTASPKKHRHSYPPEFEAFWSVYPRKQDKNAALRAWKRAVAGGASPALLREAAGRYRDNPKRDPDYTKYAERWLNAGAWMDEQEVAKPPTADARYQPYDHEAHLRALEEIQ